MGSACEITAAFPGPVLAEQALAAAVAEVERIEAKYSRYRPDSIISRINTQSSHGHEVDCDAETLMLLDHADHLFHLSQGLFDITAGVFRQVWNFSLAKVPTQQDIDAIRHRVGWQRVTRTAGKIRLNAGMELDFGGFGKEYAVDRAADFLTQKGSMHGMVNLGGDVRIIGPKPDGSPWGVGIRDPRQPTQLLASIPLSAGGLATSGDYERYFELNRTRYCHIINPQTGYPVSEWQSVTVIAPTALAAGSLSTIAMLKESAGIPFLKTHAPGFLAVDQHKRIYTHQGV